MHAAPAARAQPPPHLRACTRAYAHASMHASRMREREPPPHALSLPVGLRRCTSDRVARAGDRTTRDARHSRIVPRARLLASSPPGRVARGRAGARAPASPSSRVASRRRSDRALHRCARGTHRAVYLEGRAALTVSCACVCGMRRTRPSTSTRSTSSSARAPSRSPSRTRAHCRRAPSRARRAKPSRAPRALRSDPVCARACEQSSCIKIWGGKDDKYKEAQAQLCARAQANSEACVGKYVPGSQPSIEESLFVKNYAY